MLNGKDMTILLTVRLIEKILLFKLSYKLQTTPVNLSKLSEAVQKDAVQQEAVRSCSKGCIWWTS